MMRCDDRPARRRSIVAAGLAGALVGMMGRPARAADAAVGETRIPVEGGEIGGVQAVPARPGPSPCVVVIGDTDRAAVCQRLAGAGYAAMGADVFSGEPGDEAVLRRVDAAFQASFQAGQQGSGDPARAALVGFGPGGRIAWLYAAQRASLKAAVAWGGAVSGPATHGKTPLLLAAELKVPLLGLYGTDDASNTRTVLLRAETASRGRAELVSYVGAGADFGVEGRPGYDKAAALDGWERMLAWLKRHGVA